MNKLVDKVLGTDKAGLNVCIEVNLSLVSTEARSITLFHGTIICAWAYYVNDQCFDDIYASFERCGKRILNNGR